MGRAGPVANLAPDAARRSITDGLAGHTVTAAQIGQRKVYSQ